MLLLISLPISVHIPTAAAAAPQPQVIVSIPTLLRRVPGHWGMGAVGKINKANTL